MALNYITYTQEYRRNYLQLQYKRCTHFKNAPDFCMFSYEFHYLFVCKNPTLVQMRSKYIPTYFINVPTNHKMYGLLSHCNIPLLNRLSLYVRKTSPLFWNMSVTSMPLRDQFVFILIICNKLQRYRIIQRKYTDNCIRLTFIKQNRYLNCTEVRYRCQYKYYVCLTLYCRLKTITFLNCISMKTILIWNVE